MLEITATPSSQLNPWGGVTGGHIKARGFIKRGVWSKSMIRREIFGRVTEELEENVVWMLPDGTQVDGTEGSSLSFDIEKERGDYKGQVISYLMISDQFQGMALVPTGNSEAEYRRIGWISIVEHNGYGMEEEIITIV